MNDNLFQLLKKNPLNNIITLQMIEQEGCSMSTPSKFCESIDSGSSTTSSLSEINSLGIRVRRNYRNSYCMDSISCRNWISQLNAYTLHPLPREVCNTLSIHNYFDPFEWMSLSSACISFYEHQIPADSLINLLCENDLNKLTFEHKLNSFLSKIINNHPVIADEILIQFLTHITHSLETKTFISNISIDVSIAKNHLSSQCANYIFEIAFQNKNSLFQKPNIVFEDAVLKSLLRLNSFLLVTRLLISWKKSQDLFVFANTVFQSLHPHPSSDDTSESNPNQRDYFHEPISACLPASIIVTSTNSIHINAENDVHQLQRIQHKATEETNIYSTTSEGLTKKTRSPRKKLSQLSNPTLTAIPGKSSSLPSSSLSMSSSCTSGGSIVACELHSSQYRRRLMQAVEIFWIALDFFKQQEHDQEQGQEQRGEGDYVKRLVANRPHIVPENIANEYVRRNPL